MRLYSQDDSRTHKGHKKDNPLVVMCSVCGVAVSKAMIQISEGAIFYYRKKTGS